MNLQPMRGVLGMNACRAAFIPCSCHASDYLPEDELLEAIVMNRMRRAIGVAAATGALVVFAFDVQAQAPMKKSPACSTLKEEGACKTRDDCMWVAALIDAKTQKEKRKAYCRAAPKPAAKK